MAIDPKLLKVNIVNWKYWKIIIIQSISLPLNKLHMLLFIKCFSRSTECKNTLEL